MADALTQIPCFADINHRPEPIAHQVDTRLVREAGDFFANVLGHWHASLKLQAVGGRWQGQHQSEARNKSVSFPMTSCTSALLGLAELGFPSVFTLTSMDCV